MRKLVIACVALSVLTFQAQAQQRGTEQGPTPEELQKKREAAELDQKYKASLKAQSNAQSTQKDPWANMRGPADGKQK